MSTKGGDNKASKPDANIHSGHRMRLKQRYAEHGLENFNDINALELLLCYAIPRRDTNVIAHSLLERFGSFREVLEASIQDLAGVKGMGESSALLIKLVADMAKRYMLSCNEIDGKSLDDVGKLGSYFVSLYMYERVEIARVVCLDSMLRPISVSEISRGTSTRTPISKKLIIDAAIKSNASAIALCHNHVRSSIYPSEADIKLTRELSSLLNEVGIRFVDHIIVMGDQFHSMRADLKTRALFVEQVGV